MKALGSLALRNHPLPPAGLRGRDADDVLRAAWTWGQLELLAAAGGLREGGRRYAVVLDLRCTNCVSTPTPTTSRRSSARSTTTTSKCCRSTPSKRGSRSPSASLSITVDEEVRVVAAEER